MKWQQLILSVAFPVVLSGCLWPFRSTMPSASSNTPASSILVEVLRPDLLAKGRKLVFVPFTAGVNAEAGQRLDRLALMIVKGASDTFQGISSPIQMIDQGDPDAADMVLEGRIEDFQTSGGWKALGIGRKDGVMVLKGEVRERLTNEILVLISGRREFREAKDADAVAYDVGHGIAEQLIQEESRP